MTKLEEEFTPTFTKRFERWDTIIAVKAMSPFDYLELPTGLENVEHLMRKIMNFFKTTAADPEQLETFKKWEKEVFEILTKEKKIMDRYNRILSKKKKGDF